MLIALGITFLCIPLFHSYSAMQHDYCNIHNKYTVTRTHFIFSLFFFRRKQNMCILGSTLILSMLFCFDEVLTLGDGQLEKDYRQYFKITKNTKQMQIFYNFLLDFSHY